MPADIWRELSLLGHWIVDAVVLRWASLTERFSYRKGVTAGDVLPLLLVKPAPERATALARQAFELAGLNRCDWSGKPLRKEFVVDHAIPFSLWGNNCHLVRWRGSNPILLSPLQRQLKLRLCSRTL
jgi:hypothetical protein